MHPGFLHVILLHVQEEGTAAALVLHLQEMLGSLALLLGHLAEEVAPAFQSHIIMVDRTLERGRCRRPAGTG